MGKARKDKEPSVRIQSMLKGTAAFTAMLAFALSSSRAAPEDLDDRDITWAVETELIQEQGVPAHKIDVATQDGQVTLSGSIDSYYAKLRAEDVAERVKGVTDVDNDIRVVTPLRLDSQIRADVLSALLLDPATESFQIDVTVEQGVVTLRGEVDSFSEKMLAGEAAEDVQGVVDVENELTYELNVQRPDHEIAPEIRGRLRADASIDSGLINVLVREGQVTLQGSVGSSAERSEAESKAWQVSGVKAVDNNLKVQWWARDDMSDWARQAWTDEDAEKAVEERLAGNPRVESFKVEVSVADGVATLTGKVDNLLARRAAGREASDTLGVRRVKNFLRVRPAESRSDAEIAADLSEALQRSPYVDRHEVSVRVSNGKAFLAGEVPSFYMKKKAEKTTAAVPGVIAIQNNIDVDYEPADKTDQEIAEDIEGQLWWSPFVDSDDISVEVHHGVATLVGTVEDWDELQAAKENAREGGATSIVSKLKVENWPSRP